MSRPPGHKHHTESIEIFILWTDTLTKPLWSQTDIIGLALLYRANHHLVYIHSLGSSTEPRLNATLHNL